MLDRTGLGLSVPEVELQAEVVGRKGLEHLEVLEPEPGQLVEELKMDLPRCLE